MAEKLKPYRYVVHGIEHTILCTEADAKLYGATPVAAPAGADTKADHVENKIRVPRNKTAE